MSPTTLDAVPPIPMMASTPAMSATISSGNPNIVSTADKVTNPAAGTPAVPMDKSVPITIINRKSESERFRFVMLAAKTRDIPIRSAPPSELKTAPNGRAKLAVFSETPAFLAASIAMGSDAILLEVKKAVA